nr:retrovirus-related Pol polyprotein from transposon TNT 1-94 [Tanacetum cinerariifolium]
MTRTKFDIKKFDGKNDFGLWQEIEYNRDLEKVRDLYMTKSLANHLYLKKMLYTLYMHPGKSQSKHIDEFHKLVSNLAAIDTTISDEDQKLQKMTKAKGDGGEGFYVRGEIWSNRNRAGYVLKLRQNLMSLGTPKKEGFTVKMQSDKIKVIKGSLMVLSGIKRANCVYTVDGQAVTNKTLNGRKQFGEYHTG